MEKNNPLWIKNDKRNPWKGSTGTDARGHAIFSAPEWGIRAAVRSLAAKYAAGKRSLLAICSSWAPSSDTQGSIPGGTPNNPSEYATFCARWLDVGVNTDLQLFDERGTPRDIERVYLLVDAMAQYEHGRGYVLPSSALLMGIALYLRDFVEASR